MGMKKGSVARARCDVEACAWLDSRRISFRHLIPMPDVRDFNLPDGLLALAPGP